MNDKSSPSRDYIGYTDQPPDVMWPEDARDALNFRINYQKGSEPRVY